MTARRTFAAALIALLAASCAPTPSAPAPARALIFIPGFGGSELVAANAGSANVTLDDHTTRTISVAQNEQVWPHFHSSWPPDLWTPVFDPDYYRILRMDTGTDNLGIHASGNLYTDLGGYGEVESSFRNNGYTTGTTLFLFGWDWRRSADEEAQRLNTLVASLSSVDIVAHSAGTLVARAFLSNAGYASRSKVVHAVLLGGPGLGVPEGDDTLLVGHCLHVILSKCIVPPGPQHYAFATSEGAAQNTTGQVYYDKFHDPDGPHPVAYTTAGLADAVPSAQLTYQFLKDTLAQGMPDLPMSSAASFRQTDLTWIGKALTDNTSLSMAIGGGSGKCALGQLRNSARVDRVQIDGDTVVPRQSAIFGEGLDAGYLTGIPSGRLFIFVRPLEHGELSGNAGLPTTLAWLRGDTSLAQGTIYSHTCPATAP